MMKIGLISPQDWGLSPAPTTSTAAIPGLGVSPAELERRIYGATYDWLPRQFDAPAGAFYGFYRAPDRTFEPPQTVNLIAPWQLLATYDHYGDAALLERATLAADWFYRQFVMTHPMSVAVGGVFESHTSQELWTKFAAEYALLSLGLHARTGDAVHLTRARQSAGFLVQSARHCFAPRYDVKSGRWLELGWQSFGRAVEAYLLLAAVTGEARWHDQARAWGELGLSLVAPDGGLYLIDGEYFNTDIAADELRAFTFLYEVTGEARFLAGAEAFAGWLLAHQRADGAWPLTIDRDGNVVVPTVGPGDMPNIAIALFRLHAVTGHNRYLDAAKRTLAYALTLQVLPGSDQPYADDPNVQWGFWSWDPAYDYTLSGDQATHHVRGFLFALDYLHAIGWGA
jgi:hypothetical protein